MRIEIGPPQETASRDAADRSDEVGLFDGSAFHPALRRPDIDTVGLQPIPRPEKARETPGKGCHVDMTAENDIDRAVMPGDPEGHQRIEQPAEYRGPLADVRGQGNTAGVAETRDDEYLCLLFVCVRALQIGGDQRLEQILVIAGDAAGSAIAIADQSN